MNFSWLPVLGGGLATAITIAVGADLTDLASAFASAPTPEPITVYVEQPIIEIEAPMTEGDPLRLPPLVIAVLPPQGAVAPTTASSDSSGIPVSGEAPGGSGAGGNDALTPPTYSDDDRGPDDDHHDGEGGQDGDHEGSDD